MLKSPLEKKKIDTYITAVIVPSIILSIVALLTLVRQYRFIQFVIKTGQASNFPEYSWLGTYSQVSIFSFAMIIFALLLILIIGSYISTQDMQRQIELTRLKNDFISNVSHELKTPLTSIRVLAERLIKLPANEEAKLSEYHQLILKQSYRLSHLIENILDFSKLEEGKQNYKSEKINLTELIRQTIDDYPIKLIRPDVSLETTFENGIPEITVDKASVTRAFINILDNALKASPDSGLITITARLINEEIILEVHDQGKGIEEKDKTMIFERFYHTGQGTGLGLSLARRIMEDHNGRIEFESQKASGTKFKIIFPIKNRH